MSFKMYEFCVVYKQFPDLLTSFWGINPVIFWHVLVDFPVKSDGNFQGSRGHYGAVPGARRKFPYKELPIKSLKGAL